MKYDVHKVMLLGVVDGVGIRVASLTPQPRPLHTNLQLQTNKTGQYHNTNKHFTRTDICLDRIEIVYLTVGRGNMP